jgi:hypothetical protein
VVIGIRVQLMMMMMIIIIIIIKGARGTTRKRNDEGKK